MFQSLDIFKTNPDGSVLWRGSAEDFVSAKRCIEKLALSAPGEYLILNQRTGHRQRMRVDQQITRRQPATNGAAAACK